MAGSSIPDDLRYTEEHEWVRVEGDLVRLGITDYAQDALTDVVYAELPEEGDSVAQGDSLGIVESVKSVSDIYAPVDGEVAEANDALLDHPELLNEDPYGDGWFAAIHPSDPTQVENLLTPEEYAALLEGEA